MTNKLKYFVGNWKMFGDLSSIKIIYKIYDFCNKFKKKHNNIKIIMCVPNTIIYFFLKKIKSSFFYIGAQNCHHYEKSGPYTGSVNALMLKKLGTKYIILGHSENRYSGDTNSIIKKKIDSALKQNLNVIFCVGETLKEKMSGKTFSILRNQLKNSLDKKFKLANIIIAYEPVWSIGTGKIPTTKELKNIFKFIKIELKKKFKQKKEPHVLYGGSVNDININKFSIIDDIDGFLIGGASQTSKKFIDIIKNYYKKRTWKI